MCNKKKYESDLRKIFLGSIDMKFNICLSCTKKLNGNILNVVDRKDNYQIDTFIIDTF